MAQVLYHAQLSQALPSPVVSACVQLVMARRKIPDLSLFFRLNTLNSDGLFRVVDQCQNYVGSLCFEAAT